MAKKSLADHKSYTHVFVDAMNLLVRSYHGMSELSFNGKKTGMLYGAARLFASYRHSRIIFIWEGKGSWRKDKYPSYKAKRKYDRSDSSEFFDSIERTKQVLPLMGVGQVWADKMEADDVAPYLVKWALVEHSGQVLLVSTDEDWYAHLGANVDILCKNVIKSACTVERELGFPPNKVCLYKTLKGCSSDEVKGIPRFPSKLAVRLTAACDTWKDAISTMELCGENAWAKKAKQHLWILERNAELVYPATIKRSMVHFIPGKYSYKPLCKALLGNGMEQLVGRLEG